MAIWLRVRDRGIRDANYLKKEKAMDTIVKAFCSGNCTGACGILVTVRDGKAIEIRGNPDCPINKGSICPKGRAQLELLYHPNRLRYPRKRQGERGEGRWQRVSWDEALTTIAQRLDEIKRQFGPQSVVLAMGTPKGLELAFIQRFASLFGTPNVVPPGHICHMVLVLASTYTCGSPTIPDYEHPPRCLMVWGSNPLQTNEDAVTRARFRPALDKGAKLIVIDPRETNVAAQASLWLRPRPGSDGALALGMINAIIENKLYDADFVTRWTTGFDQLTELIKDYPLSKVEEITWVPKEQIREAARLYATTRPAAIQWGNALEHTSNSFQTCRAISILRAICGNLDIPGGDLMIHTPRTMRPSDFMLLRKFPRDREKMIGSDFRVATGSFLVPRQLVIKTILEEKPYPVKALCLFGSNPLLTYANASEVYNALTKLVLLVVSELFMTPTAELADVVLPAAANLELDDIGYYGSRREFIVARSKVVEPEGECWPDYRMINELAKKLGFEEYFWNDASECLDLILQPTYLTFDEFKKVGILRASREYKEYERNGFRTPSQKVEIYSEQLKQLGYEPLPGYKEPPETPVSSPELAKEYPLVLTSAKSPYFFHSSGRNLPTLRRMSPDPLVEINPETASQLGIRDGDWVYIETKRGKIRQKTHLNAKIDPRVIIAAYGWWFPEKLASELYGWDQSNINLLTESMPPYSPEMASPNLRGMLCKVSKA